MKLERKLRRALGRIKRAPLTTGVRSAGQRAPLGPLFRALEWAVRVAPYEGHDPSWARAALGLEGEAFTAWRRRVYWGHLVREAVSWRMRLPGGWRAVEPLVEPTDWARLDALRAQGKGVLVVMAHVGATRVATSLLAAHEPGVMQVSTRRKKEFINEPHDSYRVHKPEKRAFSLITALAHLRAGGIVCLSVDGRYLGRAHRIPVLGHPALLSAGPPALARMAQVPALPFATLWEGGRLVTRLGDVIPPPKAGEPEGDLAWLQSFGAWFGGVLAGAPENVHPRNRVFGEGRKPRARAV